MQSQRIGPSARSRTRVCHIANANLFFIFYPNLRIWGAFSFQLSADYETESKRENVPQRKCIMCVYNMRQYHITRHASAAQAPACWPKGFSLHAVCVFFSVCSMVLCSGWFVVESRKRLRVFLSPCTRNVELFKLDGDVENITSQGHTCA